MQIDISKVPPDYSRKIAVLRAFDRPIEQIKVADICANAHISRKVFYTLFPSKYEVYPWYLELCFSLSLYEVGRTLTWREGITACLELTGQERAAFMVDFSNQESKTQGRYQPLNRRRIDEMGRTLREWRHVEVDETLQMEMALYAPLVPGLIRTWLISGSTEATALERSVNVWYDCVPDRLRAAMELPKQ